MNQTIVIKSGRLTVRTRLATVGVATVLAAGGYAAAAAVMCAPLTAPPMPPVGAACGAVATVHGAQGACPFPGPSTITYWSTDDGTYCKN
jgi:hypothetical protein